MRIRDLLEGDGGGGRSDQQREGELAGPRAQKGSERVPHGRSGWRGGWKEYSADAKESSWFTKETWPGSAAAWAAAAEQREGRQVQAARRGLAMAAEQCRVGWRRARCSVWRKENGEWRMERLGVGRSVCQSVGRGRVGEALGGQERPGGETGLGAQ